VRARNARRRLWAALAAAALLALGAPLHQHAGVSDAAPSGFAAADALAGAIDTAPCSACQVGGRGRLALAASSHVLRVPVRLALRVSPADAPLRAAAAARGPAPPRGPPLRSA
jgi:CxxC motif-containing protein (DUF1111 family)